MAGDGECATDLGRWIGENMQCDVSLVHATQKGLLCDESNDKTQWQAEDGPNFEA